MATLQKIRSKGILLAVIVGLALLAFVIGDFLNSGSSLFQQSKQKVAEINGEKINIQTYQQAIDQMNIVYKIEFGRSDFNENEMAQIRTQVWESLLNEHLLSAEAAKMGLTVSSEELKERLIGNNIHPLIQQRSVFVDPQTGQFNQAALLQFYNNVFNDDLPAESQEQLHEAKSYWLFWENAVKNAILQDKYTNLISKSVGANSKEAKFNYDARKMSGDVNFVSQSYFSIPDSVIQVTDAELKAKYDKKKKRFKQDPSRTVNYVAFEVEPLAEDFNEAQEWMDKVSEEFRTSDDVIELVNAESDVTYDDKNAYTQSTVPANLKEFAFSNSDGAIYGPVFQNNTHLMAKIIQSGIMESDSVNMRYLVLAPTEDKKADSIVNALKSGASFVELAAKNSLTHNPTNNAETGWIPRSSLNKDISEPAFSKGINEVFKVSNPQGIQIFQIIERTPARKKVKLAILERKVTPSNQSYSKFYNDAKQFAAASLDLKKFEEVAKEKGYVVRPAAQLTKNSDNINMIPQSRQIVRWAFENNKGKISDVFDCDRNTYIVAAITEVNNEEYASLAQVTPQLKADIVRDKKAEIIKKELADQLAKTPSIDGLAAALGVEVRTATNVNFASYTFGDVANEPFIIGKASVLAEGQISTPLRGNSGVFVIVPLAKQADTTPFNAKNEEMQLNYRNAQSLPYLLLQKLRDVYTVVDNRSNFY